MPAPVSPVTALRQQKSRPNATNASPVFKRCSTPTARRATRARYCSFCREWTLPARAASSKTLWERAIRWGSATPGLGRPPRMSAHTTSCGGSATHCRRPVTSVSSIARTTRTYWWSGSTSWCPVMSGKRATTRSTPSRRSSPSRVPPWSRSRCSSLSMSRSVASPNVSNDQTGIGSTTRAISTSGNYGRPTRRRIRRCWTGRRPNTRRGSCCHATRSGTASWPSPNS